MPIRGMVKIYNRLPYKLEFQFDGAPYELEPHTEEVVPLPVALAAERSSVYKYGVDGEWKFGIAIEGLTSFEPLGEEELQLNDPIGSNQIEFTKDKAGKFIDSEGHPVELIQTPTSKPTRRRSVDRHFEFMASHQQPV